MTDEMEQAIVDVISEVQDYGGVEKAIGDGWLQRKIARRALDRKIAIDTGTIPIIGVNQYQRPESTDTIGDVFRLKQILSPLISVISQRILMI